jgi:hypothetical protein
MPRTQSVTTNQPGTERKRKTLSPAGRRAKGASGEREALRLLEELLELPKNTLERNCNQWASGGEDVRTLPYFSLEIKKQATPKINQWWEQTVAQAQKSNKIPLLLYRVDRQREWTAVTSLEYMIQSHDFLRLGQTPVSMTLQAFIDATVYHGDWIKIRKELLGDQYDERYTTVSTMRLSDQTTSTTESISH